MNVPSQALVRPHRKELLSPLRSPKAMQRVNETPTDLTPPGWLKALPITVLLFGLVIDFALPAWFEVRFILAAVPPLCAIVYSPLRTAGLSAVAVLASIILSLTYGVREEIFTLEDLGSLVVVSALCVVLAFARQHIERRLNRMHGITEAMVRTLLVPVPPRLGHLDTAAFYQASDESLGVGGDCYDFQETSFGVRVIIADVRGKGLGAVGTTAAILGTFREAAHSAQDLPQLASCLDARLERHKKSIGPQSSELFATALLFEFLDAESSVTIVNCGHPAPLLFTSDGAEALDLPNPGLPLGLQQLVARGATQDIDVVTIALRPGETVLAFTDGVTETRNRLGDFYPIQNRLAYPKGQPRRPVDVVDFIRKDLDRYAGKRKTTDDVAVIAMSARY